MQRSLNGLSSPAGLLTSVLFKGLNLSDIPNPALARQNLGLIGSVSAGNYLTISNNYSGTTNEVIAANASTNATPSSLCAYDVSGNITANSVIGNGSLLTGFTAAQIPSLDASKITTGTFTTSQIPSLDASKISGGNLSLGIGAIACGAITTIATTANIVAQNATVQAPRCNFDIIRPYTPGGNVSFNGNITMSTNTIFTNNISPSSGNYVSLNNKYMNYISGMSFTPTATLFCNSFDDPSHDPIIYPSQTGGASDLKFNYNNLTQIQSITFLGSISGNGSGLTSFTASQIPSLDAAKITTGTLSSSRIPTLPYQNYRTIWSFQGSKNGITSNGSTVLTDMHYVFNMTAVTNTTTFRYAIPFVYLTGDVMAYFSCIIMNNGSTNVTNIKLAIYQSSYPTSLNLNTTALVGPTTIATSSVSGNIFAGIALSSSVLSSGSSYLLVMMDVNPTSAVNYNLVLPAFHIGSV